MGQVMLRRKILGSQIGLSSVWLEKSVTIGELLEFKSGDVIPIELPDSVTLKAEDVPLFSGQVGVSNGNYAIRINEEIKTEKYRNTP